MFLATGNTDKEIKFSVDITFKAVEEFFKFQGKLTIRHRQNQRIFLRSQ